MGLDLDITPQKSAEFLQLVKIADAIAERFLRVFAVNIFEAIPLASIKMEANRLKQKDKTLLRLPLRPGRVARNNPGSGLKP